MQEGITRTIAVKYIGGRPKSVEVTRGDSPKPRIKVSKKYDKIQGLRRTLAKHSNRLYDLELDNKKIKQRVFKDSYDIDTLYLMVESTRRQNTLILLASLVLVLSAIIVAVIL